MRNLGLPVHVDLRHYRPTLFAVVRLIVLFCDPTVLKSLEVWLTQNRLMLLTILQAKRKSVILRLDSFLKNHLSKSTLIFQAMLRNLNVGEPVRCFGFQSCSNW